MSNINPENINTFNQMCYELLVAHKNSKQHILLLEELLKRPVAILTKDISITWANEGRNDFIRNMLNSAHHFMNNKQHDDKVKTVKRKRREVINND